MGNYNFKINGHAYSVAVNSIEGNIAKVNVNGTDYNVELPDSSTVSVKSVQSTVAPAAAPEAAPTASSSAPTGGKNINSPLPGVIIEVSAREGQSVKRGDKIAVLEAMKMENEIQSPVDGTVTAIKVQKGDSILEGALIATIG